jgi:LuxR family maltose regulon positive regulatory protein
MSLPILNTKLYIPPSRPYSVLRPRLSEQLTVGLQGKLTLISAPAGFGKTTLLSEWVAACEEPVAWLSLDEEHSDPTRFFVYFVAALRTIARPTVSDLPQLGEAALSALQSNQPPPLNAILTTLINELTAISENFILVLDDYHLIESQAVDQALSFLLQNLPPPMHLVMATREDPSLPLARLRARGQLTELRAHDLRFTQHEAAEFLNQAMSLNLSGEDITALENRTEGWIAGLQLAALALQGISLQGHQDTAGFIHSFSGSHHFVLDYLVEEVLQQQPEPVQHFLLCTSILERLCGSLCEALLPPSAQSGQEILEYLARANLLLIPLDEQREWYRYHHLFTDALRVRLTKAYPDDIVNLHRRACAWYEQNNLYSEAIRHALAAEDFARVATLMEVAWPAMRRNRGEATLLRWFRMLPEELIRVRPTLSMIYAWVLLDGNQLDAVERRLQDAEQWLQRETEADVVAEIIVADEAQLRALPASIANARAYLAQARGNAADTIKYVKQALELLPEENHYERGTSAAFLGLAYWTNGDLEAAYRTFADALAMLQLGGGTLSAIGGTSILAYIRVAQGRLHAAAQISKQSLRRAAALDEPLPLATADLHRGLSEIYREWGELTAAAEELQRSQALGRQATTPSDQYHRLVAEARLLATQDDLDGAFDLIQQAEQLYYTLPIPNVYPVAALKTRLLVRLGKLAEAQGWVRESGLSPGDDLGYLHEYDHITLARVLIAQYQHDRQERLMQEALGLLARLLLAAEAGERMSSVLEILLLQALAHEAQGDIPAALVPLARALALAEPEGYVRTFVDEGAPMARLLKALADQEIMHEYVGKLLTAFEAEQLKPTVDSSPLPSQPAQSLIEPLSPRELDVLRLLKTKLSGREIAHELVVALSTIRTHTKSIYSKLNVNNRRAAVQRAEELNLI